jgi:hypothetical protein
MGKTIEIPADVAADIEEMSKASGMSAQQQTEHLLRFSLGNFPRRETLFEAAKRIAAMTPKGVVQTPSELLIREERDK